VIVYQPRDSTFQQLGTRTARRLSPCRAAETGRQAVPAALTGVTAPSTPAGGHHLVDTGQKGVVWVRMGLMPDYDITWFDRIGELSPAAAIGILS